MSREETFSKVGFARAFAMVAPATDETSMQIDVDTLTAVLEALPGYAEITLTFIDGVGTRRVFDIMARDFPHPGRRFTNLTHGNEWFDIAKILVVRDDVQYITATRRGEEQPMLFVSL
jgi:hypothetical protein